MTPEEMLPEEAFRRARAQKMRIALQRDVILSLAELGMTDLLPPARRVLARLQWAVERDVDLVVVWAWLLGLTVFVILRYGPALVA